MGVDISNDQVGIYCRGTNGNRGFAEPVIRTHRSPSHRRPAPEMPFFNSDCLFFFSKPSDCQ